MSSMRKERIERLLKELEYELKRGVMEDEIDETMVCNFIIPISHSIPKGVVACSFEMRPMPSKDMYIGPRLTLVVKEKK